MKFFQKFLLVIAALSVSAPSWAHDHHDRDHHRHDRDRHHDDRDDDDDESNLCHWNCKCDEDSSSTLNNPRYKRVIVLSIDKPWPGPEVPTDPNHATALSLTNKRGQPLYTQAELNALDTAAMNHFLATYGIDFSVVPPDPNTGVRVIPGVATFLPAIIGADKRFSLILDTKNPERSSCTWYDLEVLDLILFTGTGTIPSGTNAGDTYRPGNIYSFGHINLLKNNSNKREVINFSTNWLSVQTPDERNNRTIAISTNLIDEKGRRGLYLAATAILKDPETGALFLQERPVLTWDCPED